MAKIKDSIKGCPFCGKKAKVRRMKIKDHKTVWMIGCACEEVYCEPHPSTGWNKSKADAIEAWNRRANDVE